MSRRSLSARRAVRCVGIAACVTIAAAWCISIFLSVGLHIGRHSVGVSGGVLLWHDLHRTMAQGLPALEVYANRRDTPSMGSWWIATRTFSSGSEITLLPLWIPGVLALLPTAWLFLSDRRVHPGQCPKCRYDRAGIDPAAPCPECGAMP